MLAACFITLPILYSGYRVDRVEGAILSVYYVGYVGFLLLDAQSHDALPHFSGVMLAFVVPLTLFVIAYQVYRSYKRSAPERVVTRDR